MARAILGVSAQYHDAAACLLVDGVIVAAAQEERFSRIKHDPALPVAAARFCLARAGLGPADLEAVVFYEKPLLKLDRLLQTHLAIAPGGARSFARAMPRFFRERLFVGDDLGDALGTTAPVWYAEHHASHAASAFYPSPFEEAAILTLDGVGEWATGVWARGSGRRIELLAEQRFPHSLGLLYAACTAYLGFEVNDGEYKVMGLAPYGEPHFVERIRGTLVDVAEDGSVRLDLRYLDLFDDRAMIAPAFAALFGGPPRARGAPIQDRHRDVARSIQAVTEEVVLRQARALHARTGLDRVCLAGGVALNAVANGRLLAEGPFREVWVQPAATDAGGAIGAALWAWHEALGQERTAQVPDALDGVRLGPEYDDDAITRALEAAGLVPRRAGAGDVAERLAAGQVVGLFDGRMELGPRALGARSILADPLEARMRDVLNDKVKHREPFRPFAPAVLEEDAPRLFQVDRALPYMTVVVPATDEGQRQAAAAVHVDGTARLQTVAATPRTALRAILEAFRARTSRSALLNTSFNLAGEPIVCSPEDAISTFLRTEIDALAIGPFVVERPVAPVTVAGPPVPPRPRGWARVRQVLRAVGARQAQVVLMVAYFLVVTPYAWVTRLVRGDFLGLRGRGGQSTMHPRMRPPGDIRRMY
jgi:carbamoyltransferase